ncbi:hypothetical protein [Streptomyces sp. NPDC053720]|uniref:hypothetical protein n=1 Tax=Streptomyces sp. NPDC053720 TaxID=3154855 RepID=UPI003430659A
MNRNRMRRRMMLALATTALGALSIAASPSASANPVLIPKVYTDATDGDSGGVSAFAELSRGTNLCYRAAFHAKGETLDVWDRCKDGYEAKVTVKVYNLLGILVDLDEFTAGQDTTFNLGTPDGSGDIHEGYKVVLVLSAAGFSTPPIKGTA